MNDLRQEFDEKVKRLVNLCRKVADGVLLTNYNYSKNVRDVLLDVAEILVSEKDVDAKKLACGSIRHLFHKEGFHEGPGPKNYKDWDNDLDELYDLSTIFNELKYQSVNKF